jgi:hypothetical protein
MNGTEQNHFSMNGMNSLKKWPLLCAMLALSLVRFASAADAFYSNAGVVNYPGNTNNPPVINATNFVNTGTFVIDFLSFAQNLAAPFYETSDTLNYTNTGLMRCDSGFQFDTRSSQTGDRSVASSFFNSGSVSCKIASDPNTNYPAGGQCLVNATNIVVSGSLVVGDGGNSLDGLIRLSGQNVDLTRSTLTVEGTPTRIDATPDIAIIASWDPNQNLTKSSATSGQLNVPLGQLSLPNSTPYVVTLNYTVTNAPSGGGTNSTVVTNSIVRAVFIQDFSSPTIPSKVFISSLNPAKDGGNTSCSVEWTGVYTNNATGIRLTNFLTLNNFYELSGSSNISIGPGNIPINFSFSQGTKPNTNQPTASAFPTPNVFIPGVVTNIYAFVTADFNLGSVSTNTIQNHAVTNLPGRIEISADNVLDMSLSQISGPNFVSVTATNNFAHSVGTAIQAPFVSLNVADRSGSLTLSNTVNPTIPTWSGEVNAWSTRWITVATNGATNDFGVLIVDTVNASPTSAIQEQDVVMHGTNNLVISDAMTILRTLSSDAQNLTLTANGTGKGALSTEGELNVLSSDFFLGTSLPNLRNLTNNGAIRFQNLAQFNGYSNNVTIIPGSPATAAMGLLSEANLPSNVAQNNKVIIGTNTYTFVSSLANSTPNLVKIGATFDSSMSNLIAAINLGANAGTAYSTSTVPNLLVTAGTLSNHSFRVTATAIGPDGNAIMTTTAGSANNLTWNGHLTLFGGSNAVAGVTNGTTASVPYWNFINTGLVSDQGSTIWATNFLSSGTFSNGTGSFQLNSVGAAITNGSILAGGDISFTANSLLASKVKLHAGKSLVLNATNFLGDSGAFLGNVWVVDAAAGVGLNLPIKPPTGDLMGTFITNTAATNKNVVNTWSGEDRGATNAGFANNEAVGWLALVGQGTFPYNGQFTFTGTGVSNALYVDVLDLRDSATVLDSSTNVVSLAFNGNFVIYYAKAMTNSVDVSALLNHKNNDHLRWVPTFIGPYNSMNVVMNGQTNVVNSALVAAPQISAGVQAGGTFQLSVGGGAVVAPKIAGGDAPVLTTVQASSNMVDWTNVYSGYPPFTYTETNSPDCPVRFYRAVVGQ